MVSKYWYFGFALSQIPIVALLVWGGNWLFASIPLGLAVSILTCYRKDLERGSIY